MKTGGMKVPPNTRECYEDRLCFVGRALKRYEASHIDRRHTPTEEGNVCTLCLSVNEGFQSHNLSSRRARMTFINCGGNEIKVGNLRRKKRTQEFEKKSNEGDVFH
jgi:hypothetical protein